MFLFYSIYFPFLADSLAAHQPALWRPPLLLAAFPSQTWREKSSPLSAKLAKRNVCPQSTYRYLYTKSTTVYVPSSEIGTPPPPSPASEWAPLPRNQRRGGAHSPAGEGVGESQFRRLEKRLSTLPALCLCVPIQLKNKCREPDLLVRWLIGLPWYRFCEI